MTNIISLSEKQNEQLKGNSDEEVALAAARRTMGEARRKRHIKEPDQLASGKTDEHGRMINDE